MVTDWLSAEQGLKPVSLRRLLCRDLEYCLPMTVTSQVRVRSATHEFMLEVVLYKCINVFKHFFIVLYSNIYKAPLIG